MHWMAKWPGGFPLFVADARGSRFTDVDGLEYADFCLGDTGAMSGHAPEATSAAKAKAAKASAESDDQSGETDTSPARERQGRMARRTEAGREAPTPTVRATATARSR